MTDSEAVAALTVVNQRIAALQAALAAAQAQGQNIPQDLADAINGLTVETNPPAPPPGPQAPKSP